MGEKNDLVGLNYNKPNWIRDYFVIQGITQLSEKIGRIKESKNNFFFYMVSIIFGGLIGSFLQSKNYIASFLLLNILLIMIIIQMGNKNRTMFEVIRNYREMEKQAKKFGILSGNLKKNN